MRRQSSLFEIQPSFRREVELGIDRDGCSLSGVSAKIHWEERKVSVASKLGPAWRNPQTEEEEDEGGVASDSSQDDEEETEGATAAPRRAGTTETGEIWPIRRLYKGVHLTLNQEAASLLPVVLRYKLIFNLKQTFQNFKDNFILQRKTKTRPTLHLQSCGRWGYGRHTPDSSRGWCSSFPFRTARSQRTLATNPGRS